MICQCARPAARTDDLCNRCCNELPLWFKPFQMEALSIKRRWEQVEAATHNGVSPEYMPNSIRIQTLGDDDRKLEKKLAAAYRDRVRQDLPA